MKDSIRFFVGLNLLILITCFGCGPASSEAEMKAAQEAMEVAKSFSAEDLATSDWNDAIQAWEEAQAAVEQGKSAKTLFLTAKSRFEKTGKIAKSHHERISGEVSNMQGTINEGMNELQSALDAKLISSRAQKEIKPIMEEVEAGSESINELLDQGSLLEASDLARDLQKKVYNAQLIMEGKKPTF